MRVEKRMSASREECEKRRRASKEKESREGVRVEKECE